VAPFDCSQPMCLQSLSGKNKIFVFYFVEKNGQSKQFELSMKKCPTVAAMTFD